MWGKLHAKFQVSRSTGVGGDRGDIQKGARMTSRRYPAIPIQISSSSQAMLGRDKICFFKKILISLH